MTPTDDFTPAGSPLLKKADVRPANLTSFPKQLGSDVDDSMHSHKSYELVQALASYSAKMASVNDEYAKLQVKDRLFEGQSSQDLAKVFEQYANAHHGEALPAEFLRTKLYSTNGSSMTLPALPLSSGAYSWTDLLTQVRWARIIYCIVWVSTGLLLIFFGYASFFWLTSSRSGSQAHKRRPKERSFLRGGVAGMISGFLFFSYLASVINNTLCANEGKTALSSGAFFAIWLVSGIVGAVLGGYFYLMAKVMTSFLGGTSLSIILTAMFGIEAILIRAIFLAIIVTILTAPLLATRLNAIQRLILNACTSLTGGVTMLNGIALYAPPYKASSNWLDLWTMLVCSDKSTSRPLITAAWGTSAFKGYIAGAVLGAAVGFIFELLLHRQSGTDAESEWNQYLGTYTSRVVDMNQENRKTGLSLATSMGAKARAGLFEPTPTAWQRMVEYFDTDAAKYPAQYGNLSRDGVMSESITDKGRRLRLEKAERDRTRRNGPARFKALSNRDDFDDQDSECSDEEECSYISEDEEKMETKDLLSSLPSSKATSPENYSTSSISRPNLLTNSSSYNASQLSGTTAISSGNESEEKGRLSSSSPSKAPPEKLEPPAGVVTATPSLINAITRIQAAQQAARNWQRERDDQAPYNTKPE